MNKFMKNNLKVFIAIVATTVIVSGISVYATSRFLAKEIAFTPSNENFKKENGEAIDNLEDAINELYTSTSIKMDLLWTNSSPLVAFAPQTIQLDLSDYKYIVVNSTYGGNGLLEDYYKEHKSIIKVGTTGNITGVCDNGSSVPDGYAATVRKVTVNLDSIVFANGRWFNGNNRESSNYAVPLNIWGIK